MKTTTTVVTIDPNPVGGEWFITLQSSYSGPHIDATNGALANVYDIYAVQFPESEYPIPAGVANDKSRVVINLGAVTAAEAERIAYEVAPAMPQAFAEHTKPGRFWSEVVNASVLYSAVAVANYARVSAETTARYTVVSAALPDRDITELDRRAGLAGVDRSELVRRYVWACLWRPYRVLRPSLLTERNPGC